MSPGPAHSWKYPEPKRDQRKSKGDQRKSKGEVSTKKRLAWMWLALLVSVLIYFGGWSALASIALFVVVGATVWALSAVAS